MPVRNRLKEIRHSRLIDTKLEMAKLLNIGQSQYTRYENQTIQPSLEAAIIIAEKLNMKVEDVFYIEPGN
jgi:DNA-binding XRE family transcriptional regulator